MHPCTDPSGPSGRETRHIIPMRSNPPAAPQHTPGFRCPSGVCFQVTSAAGSRFFPVPAPRGPRAPCPSQGWHGAFDVLLTMTALCPNTGPSAGLMQGLFAPCLQEESRSKPSSACTGTRSTQVLSGTMGDSFCAF